MVTGPQKMHVLAKRGFLFGGLSPPNKKMTSLRPRRLCGEISILDKSDIFCMYITPVETTASSDKRKKGEKKE